LSTVLSMESQLLHPKEEMVSRHYHKISGTSGSPACAFRPLSNYSRRICAAARPPNNSSSRWISSLAISRPRGGTHFSAPSARKHGGSILSYGSVRLKGVFRRVLRSAVVASALRTAAEHASVWIGTSITTLSAIRRTSARWIARPMPPNLEGP
jgi:hypothetical protein